MFKTVAIILVTLTFMNCVLPSKASMKDQVKKSAQNMANSLVTGDYKTFTNFIFPPLLQLMGGKEKAIELFKKETPKSITIENVEIYDCSDTIKTTNEIQCTLKERITMKVSEGKLICLSTLICISTDNGNSWTFIDANDKALDFYRNQFPNLSKRLIIPDPIKPIFLK